MKKIICIALSILIVISSSGFNVSVHYCPKSKKSTYSFFQVKSCCGKKMMNCCKNKQFKINKIKSDYTVSDVFKIPTPIALCFLFSQLYYPQLLANKNEQDVRGHAHSPPKFQHISLIILNRTILI